MGKFLEISCNCNFLASFLKRIDFNIKLRNFDWLLRGQKGKYNELSLWSFIEWSTKLLNWYISWQKGMMGANMYSNIFIFYNLKSLPIRRMNSSMISNYKCFKKGTTSCYDWSAVRTTTFCMSWKCQTVEWHILSPFWRPTFRKKTKPIIISLDI